MDIYWWFKSENSRSLGLVITDLASQPATEDECMDHGKYETVKKSTIYFSFSSYCHFTLFCICIIYLNYTSMTMIYCQMIVLAQNLL
jgi:hypothetical protein